MSAFQTTISTSSTTANGSFAAILSKGQGGSHMTWGEVRNAATASANAVGYGAARVESTNTTTADEWEIISRTASAFDTPSYIPYTAYISAASYILPVQEMTVEAWEAADLAAVKLYIVGRTPSVDGRVQNADFAISRYSNKFGEIALSDLTAAVGSYITVSLNATGCEFIKKSGQAATAFGLLWSWDYDDAPPTWIQNKALDWYDYQATLGGLGVAHTLSINYETPTTITDTSRRRFELPVEPSAFVPTRRSTRYGAPIMTLQQAEAQRGELPTQIQDYLNEMPPIISRHVAVTPESQVTALSGTILVDSTLSERNLWYKKYGSGNTGWIPFAMQE